MIPSPNIWNHPDVYEIENLGVDPEGLIEATMAGIHDWSGQRVLDLGCGSGFHLSRFARTASTVVGVEPREPLAALARRRISTLSSAKGSFWAAPSSTDALVNDSCEIRRRARAASGSRGSTPTLSLIHI